MTLDPAAIDLPRTALLISFMALAISVASPAIAFYVARRDRADLRITAKVDESGIHARMVNAGRRPIVLRAVGLTTDKGHEMTLPLDPDKGVIRLGEHEPYEHTFYAVSASGIFTMDAAGGWVEGTDQEYATVLWVEDTIGTRHEVPGSREFLQRMRASKKHIGLPNREPRKHH